MKTIMLDTVNQTWVVVLDDEDYDAFDWHDDERDCWPLSYLEEELDSGDLAATS